MDYAQRQFEVKATGLVIREGETISIDGTTGTVYQGAIKTIEAELRRRA